jgi:dolichyl-phosphate beta-glucosyltransferase
MKNQNKIPKRLSIVIPLYNETKRFHKGLVVCQEMLNQNPDWECIFVNDGSTDNTKKLVNENIKEIPNAKLISYDKNRGKGYAIKRGVLKAKKEYLLFTDIDFSTPISELEKLFLHDKNNCDIVIGTRKVKEALIKVHQPFYRESLGHAFTIITNLWLGLNISDFTCGFKLFKTKVAKKIFSKQKINRWGFDAETLYLARKYKFKICEVPVLWENDAATKVSLLKDILRSLNDLIQIRINDFQKKYD